MSNTQQGNDALAKAWGVDLQKAASLVEELKIHAFVEELGNQGYKVANEEQLGELIKISAYLDQVEAQMGDQGNLFKAASASLQNAIGVNSPEALAEQQAAYDAILAKSAQIANDEEVAKHLLALLDFQNS
jgi:hypothetical protein